MIRILHVVHQYLPEHVGGTELYTKWLTDGLRQNGHQVAIFARHSADGSGLEQRDDDGVQVWLAQNGRFQPTNRFTSTFRSPPLQQAFIQTLDHFQPDLVHVEHLMGLPTHLLDELNKRQIPYVVTLWDFWWVCANAQLVTNYSQEICDGPDKFLNCAKCALARANQPQYKLAQPPLAVPLALRNRTLRHALENAAQLIVPAQFVRDWYAEHGIAADKMVVVPPGLDYPADMPRDADEKRPFRVGYIGGLSWQKGVHTLIEAFAQLPEPAQLWVAGDTTFDPDYVASLQQKATANVTFFGKLDRDAIWQMLTQVDAIVVPSLWYETFCFVISEAHAMGVPVIASNLGVLAERVHDGQDGYLFPPGDAKTLQEVLARLQANPQQLDALRVQITAVTTFQEHIHQIEAIYKQQLKGS